MNSTPDEPSPSPDQPEHIIPPPPPPPSGLSFGARLAIGLGIGVGAQVVAVVLMFASLSTNMTSAGFIGVLWPFILIAVVSGALMFSPRTRPYATGMLIITAATWLLLIGPCVVLLSTI